MLSAFKAQPTVELKSRDKSKIESLLAYGDRLLVGLNSGALRVYRITDPSSELQDFLPDASSSQNGLSRSPAKARLAECLREEEKFSRKPVQQMAIIKEANVLVSLSDSFVSLHDLQTYARSERLEVTKGATTFAVISNIVKDETTGIASIMSRLAVAVKRKLFVWTWQDMELSGPPLELALPAAIKCIAWMTGTKLVTGMDPGYTLVNIESQEASEIHKTAAVGEPGGLAGTRFGAVNSSGMSYMGMGGWVPKPMATKVGEERMLLAKDVNTLLIDFNGKPIEKRQIPWATAPDAVGYSYPYLLSLNSSRGLVEIRNPDSLSQLQSITLPNATLVHVPQPNISLAHAGKGFLIASERSIWRMEAQDYISQINDLISKQQFDEALSVANMLEDSLLGDRKDECLREIRIAKAEFLFSKRQYRESLELFSEATTPPVRVISLYPKAIAGDLSASEDNEDENGNGGENGEAAYPINSQQAIDETNSARSKSIIEASHKDSDVASIKTSASRIRGQIARLPTKLEGKELSFAVNELCAFLAQARVQLKKYIRFDGTLKEAALNNDENNVTRTPPFETFIQRDTVTGDIDWQQELLNTATIVDTTLFRAYMFANPRLAGSLFRVDNFCAPEVVKEKLYETGRFMELIDFLYGKKRHHEALELLEKFGKCEKENGMQVDEALRGPRRTVAYLQQLPFEMTDLILQYARWPIERDPDLGIEVFLADTENAETLPRHRVVDFLTKIDEKLATKYIEHITTDLADKTMDFHDRLIHLYVKEIGSRRNQPPPPQGSLDSTASLQSKLEGFLRSSQQYSKRSMLATLSKNDPTFYESRAIIHSKLLQHQQALEIYVFDLKSPEKAEAYCNATYLSSDAFKDHGSSVYTTLLSLYLQPPPPKHSHPPNLDAALSLLSRHGSRLPALSTISFLPATLPLERLEDYFLGRMRSAASESREIGIIRSLSEIERTRTEKALLVGEEDDDLGLLDAGSDGMEGLGAKGNDVRKGRNRRIVLGEDRMCAACHKRFGRAAIRVWPSGEVLHYGCGEPPSRALGKRVPYF